MAFSVRNGRKRVLIVALGVLWFALPYPVVGGVVEPTDTPTEEPTPTDTASETPTPAPTPLCESAPASGCRVADQSAFSLTNADEEMDNHLSWSWMRRGESDASAFGDPTTDSTYSLCVYATSAGAVSLELTATVAPGEIEEPEEDDDFDFDAAEEVDPATRGWKEISRRSLEGYRYLDLLTSAQDGIAWIALLANPSRSERVRIGGTGPNLPMPAPNGRHLLLQGPELIVQLLNSDGACWEAHFAGPALIDSPDRFKDKCGSRRHGPCG